MKGILDPVGTLLLSRLEDLGCETSLCPAAPFGRRLLTLEG